MIHAEGRGCQHGFSSDLCGPQCVPVAWKSWGPSLGHPTACPDPRDPAQGHGTSLRGIHFLAGLCRAGATRPHSGGPGAPPVATKKRSGRSSG